MSDDEMLMQSVSAYLELSRIPHLAELQSELRKKCQVDGGEVDANEGNIEQLPHALSSSAYSLWNVFRAEHAAIASVRKRAAEHAAIANIRKRAEESSERVQAYRFEPMERDPIRFAVDHFFDAAVRTQNAVIWYISKSLSLHSLPLSFKDLIRKLNGNPRVPEDVADITRTYWMESGEDVRRYRDLSQHFAVVSTKGRVYLLPSGHAQIHVILPNNPDSKSTRLLSYGSPDIHAYGYIRNAYVALHAFVASLVNCLLARFPPSEEHLHVINFAGGLRFDDRHRGCLLQNERAEMECLIQNLYRNCREQSF